MISAKEYYDRWHNTFGISEDNFEKIIGFLAATLDKEQFQDIISRENVPHSHTLTEKERWDMFTCVIFYGLSNIVTLSDEQLQKDVVTFKIPEYYLTLLYTEARRLQEMNVSMFLSM